MSRVLKESPFAYIKKRHGSRVAKFLETFKVIPKKNEVGSYVLPKNFIIRKWNPESFPEVSKKKVKQQKKHKSEHHSETRDLDSKDNFHLFVNFRRSTDLPSYKPAPTSSTNHEKTTLTQLSSDVVTQENIENITKQNLNARKPYGLNESARFLKGDKVFRKIIDSSSPEYHHCVQFFSPIIKIFAKRHIQFKYRIFLDSIPQDKNHLVGQLSQRQIVYFFSKILHHVVPDQLFGSRKNINKIKLTIERYFKSGSENFTLESLLQTFNINSVKWLHNVLHESNKIYLLSQVLNWFFDKFIPNIILSYLYYEPIQPGNNEKRIFRRLVKKGEIHEYIFKKVQQNVYEPVPRDQVENLRDVQSVSRLKFLTKMSGLRPVVIYNANEDLKEECREYREILKRLYLIDNPPETTHIAQRVWELMIEYRKSNPDKSLYFVSCDIADAFGSIIQEKLLEIVFQLVNRLPNQLTSQPIAIVKPIKGLQQRYTTVNCLGIDILPPSLPPGSLYCFINETSNLPKVIEKERLKELIKYNVSRHLVKFEKKYLIIKQGVAQGLPMSAILNDIYYNDMESQELAKFTASGRLFRYVDDFVYLTDDKELAEEFLEITRRGIPTYNCFFKDEKTQSNLQPYNQKEFSFLGFRYNIETLETRPEYSNIPVKYIFKMDKEGSETHNLFIRRLSQQFEWLKLYPRVLDPRFNSEETVLNTIRTAARMSAEKCFYLLINLCDLKSMNREASFRIFTDIQKRAINPLIRMCYKTLKIKGRRFEIKFEKLESIFWFEYLKMFKKNPIICQKFNSLIKKQFDSKNFAEI